tara:strand:- start:46 stop:411 length:366 start_codon:yes stop_codon:yes gene_type:complete
MESDKDELKKYLNRSSIEEIIDKKEIGLEVKTNYEALQEGTFPEKLLDEKNLTDTLNDSEIMKEIESKHAEILKERPIPELLESAELIDTLQEINPPAMGKLYEEKRSVKKEEKKNFSSEK